MHSESKKSINIAGWNIDGLYKIVNKKRLNKLTFEDVSSKIKENDIIFLIETHCSYEDVVSFEGYRVHNHIRPKSKGSKKHYGGITVLIKEEIRKGITYMPSTNSEYLWLKLSKEYFCLPSDIFMLAAYICPANSSFSGKAGNLFSLIESDIAKFSKNGKCIIYGDFNGRTGIDPDYCCNEENISKFINTDESEIIDSPIPRNNCDTSAIDQNGRALLDLCKSAGVRILNGRVPGDSLGYHTCFSHIGNPSTIDYFLASPDLLETFKFLHINNPTENSIHCQLNLCLRTKEFPIFKPTVHQNLEYIPKYHWDETASERFSNMIALHCNSLSSVLRYTEVDKESINNLAQNLTNFYHACAKKSLKSKKKPTSTAKKKVKERGKPWFNQLLVNSKQEVKRYAKLLRQNPYNRSLQHSFQIKKKEYKQAANQAKKKYEQNMISKLINLEKNNPNQFWKSYKELKNLDIESRANPISHGEWVSHFRSLFNNNVNIEQTNLDHIEQSLILNTSVIFNELNFKISKNEVKQCVYKLKNGKSSGIEGITNEMIKSSIPHM